jgi:hypothetical protein
MQKKPKTYPETLGNLARSTERLRDGSQPKFRPPLRLVEDLSGNDGPLEEPVFQLKQLVLFIGVSITLCLLWILIVFILYRIARATL